MFRFFSGPSASFVRPFHLPFLDNDDSVRVSPRVQHVHRHGPLSMLSLPFVGHGKRGRSAIESWLDADDENQMSDQDSDDEVRVIDHKQEQSKSCNANANEREHEGRLCKRARTTTTSDQSPFAFGNALSMKENEKDWSVSLNAPTGGKLIPEKISVQVNNGVMTISGTTNTESKREGNGFSYLSNSSTSFSRSLPLPRDVDEENITAELGQDAQSLALTLPKRSLAQKKTIAVAIKAKALTEKTAQPLSQSQEPNGSASPANSDREQKNVPLETKDAASSRQPAQSASESQSSVLTSSVPSLVSPRLLVRPSPPPDRQRDCPFLIDLDCTPLLSI